MSSAKPVAKAARLAGVSDALLAPKSRLAKTLRGARGGVQRVVFVSGLVGRIDGSESVVPLVDLRAGHAHARAFSSFATPEKVATVSTWGRAHCDRDVHGMRITYGRAVQFRARFL